MFPISIIVPVYNVERYLERCIKSIQKQTFTNYELILINDGSLDKSGEICDCYAENDKRISVIHKENGGLSSARNAGIRVAKGAYLFFVDSDDVIHPNALEILYSNMQNNCSDISTGNFCRFSKDSQLNFSYNEKAKKGIELSGIEILEKLYDRDIAARYVSACGKLIKRDLFDGILFPEGRLFEDEFTTYLLYYKSRKITAVDMQLYYYFVNDNGITQNLTLQKYFDEFDAQWEKILFFKKNDLTKIYHKALMSFLDLGRWQLLGCKNKKEQFDVDRSKTFEKRYHQALIMAHKEKILDFIKHYDYYVLGNPKYIVYYRIKRKIIGIIS